MNSFSVSLRSRSCANAWRGIRSGGRRLAAVVLFLLASVVCHPASAVLQVENAPATNITRLSAILQANIVSTNGTNPTVVIYYGCADGITNTTNWSYSTNLGVCSTGICQAVVSNLLPATYYYLRSYATETTNTAWATATTNFETIAGAPTSMPSITGYAVWVDIYGNLIAPSNLWFNNRIQIVTALTGLISTGNIATVSSNLSVLQGRVDGIETNCLVKATNAPTSGYALYADVSTGFTNYYWGLVPTNDVGCTNTPGSNGAPGLAATIAVAWVSNGVPGSAVVVTNVGDSNNALFGFVIPAGSNGVDGAAGSNGLDGASGTNGAAGAAATIAVAWASNGVPGSAVVVTNVGDSNNALFGFVIPAGSNGVDGAAGSNGLNGANGTNGVDGAAGTNGTDGLAATITVAWASNGVPGSAVVVTNVGSSNAAEFGFVIPAGSNGVDGAAGSNGVDGHHRAGGREFGRVGCCSADQGREVFKPNGRVGNPVWQDA